MSKGEQGELTGTGVDRGALSSRAARGSQNEEANKIKLRKEKKKESMGQ